MLAVIGPLGCSPKPPAEVPRTLSGVKRTGRFVPPFAYEAVVRGELALERGDLEGAVSAFELATAAPDEDPYVLSRLAFALALRGDKDTAASTLAHAEKIDPCSEAVWLTRGEIAERAQDLAAAELHYVRAGECAPESELGALGLARVLAHEGHSARAIFVLTQWAHERGPRAALSAFELALEAGDSVAMSQALDALVSTGAPRSEQLKRAVQKALEKGRPALAARFLEHAPASFAPSLKVRVQLALGDLDAARATLSSAPPEQLGGALEAAALYLEAGLFERAELAASDALSLEDTVQARVLRAKARIVLTRTDLALLDLDAVARDPEARSTLRALSERLGLASVASVLQ